MADQGIWFKLHCSALDDPDLDNLEISDFGRWAKLGTFTKRHGTAGTIHLAPPARALCAALQVPDFEALMTVIERFPHVTVRRDDSSVSLVTSASVTFDNWAKYQGDFSSPRVSKFREMKRSKRRGEEKRREKKRLPPASSPSEDFIEKLKNNSAYKGIDIDQELSKMDLWLSEHLGRKKTRRFVLNWLNKCDRPVKAGPVLTPKTQGNVEAFRRFVERKSDP